MRLLSGLSRQFEQRALAGLDDHLGRHAWLQLARPSVFMPSGVTLTRAR